MSDILEEAKEFVKVQRADGVHSYASYIWAWFDKLIAEVEKLRSITKLLEADNKYCRLATKDYAEQVHSLTKELDKYKMEGTGISMVARNRELEAENAELRSNAKYIADNVYMKEIKDLTAKLADTEKDRWSNYDLAVERRKRIEYLEIREGELEKKLEASEKKLADAEATLKEKVLLGLKQCGELVEAQEEIAKLKERVGVMRKLVNQAMIFFEEDNRWDDGMDRLDDARRQ